MTVRLQGMLDMNDIKQEDAMRYDCSSSDNVDGIAVIVDGATGFQKDIDSNGNIYSLPDITEGEYSSARIWADTLADEMLTLAKNPRYGMVEIMQSAIKNATKKMPVINDKFENFQSPSGAALLCRIRGGAFEVIGSGDCCLLVEYNDGNIDLITGNEILDKIRADRDLKIRKENPGFESLSKEEKAKIQLKYMKETRQNLGNRKEGYFVPFYDGDKKMGDFLGVMNVVSQNRQRGINNICRGDIWLMSSYAENIKSFMISSDGFLDKVIKNKMATPKEIIKNAQADKNYIDNLGRALRKIEIGSDGDFNAVAMKLTQGKKITGSADDAVALYFNVSVDKSEAVQSRTNTFGLALAKHYQYKSK